MPKIKTSQKIIDHATRMFALYGYNGTIMDELAEQCGVNKASIYYHHKDKATLYETSLTELFTPIIETVITAVEAETSPVARLERHIKTFASASAEQPYFTAIVMRELATGGANMPARALEQMQRIPRLLKNTLQQGESQGVFKSADPLILHFMIIGAINLFVASIPLRETLPETNRNSPMKNADIESASDQIYQTIISSLQVKIN